MAAAAVIVPGENLRLDDIKEGMKLQKVQQLGESMVFKDSNCGTACCSVIDHWLKNITNSQTELVHFVDVIDEYKGDIDLEAVETIMHGRSPPPYDSLPEPLKPKTTIPATSVMQLFVKNLGNNRWCVIKWFTIRKDNKNEKASRATIEAICANIPKMINIPNAGSGTPNYFHWLFENMGYFQVRMQSLTLKSEAMDKGDKDKGATFMASLTDEDVDAAFEYMAECPSEPSLKSKWIIKALLKANNTPVYGWPVGYLKDCLNSLQSDGSFAKKEFEICLTLRDVPEWYLDIIKLFAPQLKIKAFIQIGEPGRGKTPVAEILALALAFWWWVVGGKEGHRPCFRMTSDIDFLRGARCAKTMVDILDDPDANALLIRKMKAFCPSLSRNNIHIFPYQGPGIKLGGLLRGDVGVKFYYFGLFSTPGEKVIISHRVMFSLIQHRFNNKC